jgi:hypothetical protein
VKDTIAAVKKQVLQTAGDELKKQLFNKGDTTRAGGKNSATESAKGLPNNLNPFGKKKMPADSTQH